MIGQEGESREDQVREEVAGRSGGWKNQVTRPEKKRRKKKKNQQSMRKRESRIKEVRKSR